jgi:hypothetical protein
MNSGAVFTTSTDAVESHPCACWVSLTERILTLMLSHAVLSEITQAGGANSSSFHEFNGVKLGPFGRLHAQQ